MALPKKISDYFSFNPITNPVGGMSNLFATPGAVSPSSLFTKPGGTSPSSVFPTPASASSPRLVGMSTPNGPKLVPVGGAKPVAHIAAPIPVAPSSSPIFSSSTPVPTVPAIGSVGATGTTGEASNVPPQWLNTDGSFKTPDQIASEVGGALASAHGNGDVGNLALQQFGGGDKSAVQLEADARRVGNARNDIAVGETDPYKVASQSGIAYTPGELSAIEKAYAGIYDPALDTALAKVTAKQEADKVKAESDAKANEPYTLGVDEVRYDGQGNQIAAGPRSAASTIANSPGSALNYYIKTTQNGNKYVDLSTVNDPKEKAALQNAAQAAGIPPVTDANASKINAIDDTRANLDQIKTQFDKIGYGNGLERTIGGFGLSTNIAAAFGDANIGSFNAWRTAAINSIQALAGGAGSGLRINQAEINAAMQNDIPNKTDTLAVGNAKIEVLRHQLNNWENQLLGTKDSSTTTPITTPDGKKWTQNPDGSYTEVSFNDVGNTTASTKNSGNIPQRNNNPGDVKAGGLADSLAVGKDQYGHLIFPDSQTGFRALTADVTAKINGGSSRLPANPTIAELGRVYAEDPNWPVKVAGMLGVPVSTQTKSVPIEQLVQAIAHQEGFYS